MGASALRITSRWEDMSLISPCLTDVPRQKDNMNSFQSAGLSSTYWHPDPCSCCRRRRYHADSDRPTSLRNPQMIESQGFCVLNARTSARATQPGLLSSTSEPKRFRIVLATCSRSHVSCFLNHKNRGHRSRVRSADHAAWPSWDRPMNPLGPPSRNSRVGG